MATDVVATVKLQLDAGDASMPKLAQNLGPTGANPVQVKHAFDEATRERAGLTIPVVVTVRADGSFELAVKAPQTAALLRRAAGIDKGAATPGNGAVGRITRAQLREVAAAKLGDLNTDDLDAAERTIAGTARSMGLEVVDERTGNLRMQRVPRMSGGESAGSSRNRLESLRMQRFSGGAEPTPGGTENVATRGAASSR